MSERKRAVEISLYPAYDAVGVMNYKLVIPIC